MKLCIVTFKECWEENGVWYSYGGFPMQMSAISSLFSSVTMVVVKGKPKDGGIPLPSNANVIALPPEKGTGVSRILSFITMLPGYLKVINKHINNSDVVHTPVPGDISLLGMLLAIFKKKKLITRYGGSWENNDQTTLFSKFTKYLMRKYAGGKRVMLATGVGETPPAPKMHWIFSTVLTQADIEKINPNTNKDLGEVPQLVYIGRLSVEKGVHVLVKALHILKQENETIKFHLNIIGGGPQEGELKQLVKDFELSNDVTFCGQLNKEMLINKVKEADICVQPSLTEGFSKAWLDAFSCGLPIIASNVGAASSVIKDSRGWLVNPGDELELKQKLKQVLTDKSINWSDVRYNCSKFVTQLTIENWREKIKKIALSQWGEI